jgi:hypothetical protein
VVLLTLALAVFTLRLFEHEWVFPWLGNIFRTFHYMDGGAPIPADPAPVFPMPFWKAFSLAVIGLTYGCFLLKFATLDWRSLTQRFVVPEPLGLLMVFTLGYVPILLLKTLVPNSFGVFDRYLLPLVPLLTLALLKMFHRETGRSRVPLVGWLVLIGFAFYGAAGAHDYFEQLRARLDLTGELLKRGVPRTRIMAGVEYDAWTQITVAGFYNDSRVKLPPGTVLQTAAPLPFHTAYCLWQFTPVVRAGYVVALGRHPDLFDTDLPAATFDCWLPPYQRALIVQTPDPNLAAVRSLPIRKDP